MLVDDAEVSAEARTNEKEKVERSWEKTDKTGSTDVVLRKLAQILTFFFSLNKAINQWLHGTTLLDRPILTLETHTEDYRLLCIRTARCLLSVEHF